MMRSPLSRFVPYLLWGVGVLLIFRGARDLLDSRIGQAQAARAFGKTEPGESLARLTIPRLATELYVVEGAGERELRRGPGHLRGTAFPGENGNCVIAGHRDTHFRVLKDISVGDQIVLETHSGRYMYRVRRLRVISPDNTAPLRPAADAELNLITCYPFYYVGAAPKRFVVEAELARSEIAGSSM